MRVLMMVHPTPTHLLPTAPLAWALRAAGHDPVHLVLPNVLPTALSAGLSAVAVGEPFDEAAFLRARLPPGTSPVAALGRPDGLFWKAVALTQVQRARDTVADYTEAALELAPDLVVADPMELAGRLVAARLGVPLVRHRFGLDPLTGTFEETATGKLRVMCRQLGLDERASQAQLILDPCPPRLQDRAARAGLSYRYVPYNGPGSAPGWLRRRGERRRICITMGTLAQNFGVAPLLETVVSEAAGLGEVEVLLAARGADERLAALPGVRLVTGSPLHQFLDTCDLVVHHGGAGSTLTSACAGVPQLVLPQQGDQYGNADRILDSGAGSMIAGPEQLDRPRLRAALSELLGEPSYRRAAGALRLHVQAQPPPAAVVGVLERLASRPATSPASTG